MSYFLGKPLGGVKVKDKQIDLSSIPKQGKYFVWRRSVGREAPFNCKGITGVAQIVNFEDGDVVFKIDGQGEYRLKSSSFKACNFDTILGLRKASSKKPKTMTHEEFLGKLRLKYGDEYTPLTRFKNNRSYLLMKHEVCQYQWETTPNAILRNRRCPRCQNKVVTETNNLSAVNPRVASFFHPTKNGEVRACDLFPNSMTEYWWKCEKGHEWKLAVQNQVGRQEGCECAFCANKELLVGYNDLETKHPELIKLWDFDKNKTTPKDHIYSSSDKVWWKCEEGHSSLAPISYKVRGDSCCYCINQKLWIGWNDLATTNPEFLDMWDYEANKGITPKDVMKSNKNKLWWKCGEGHRFLRSPLDMVRRKGSCPYCTRKRPTEDYCLESAFPNLIKEWDTERNGELTPKDVLPYSSKKVWWKAGCGHHWEAEVSTRTSGGNNCPYCAGQKVLAGFNDLKTKAPEVAKEWHYLKNGGLTPEQVASGSGKKAWFICKERGHEHYTVIADKVKGVKCPYCSGFYTSEENCLETMNPEVAKEWHPFKNEDLTPRQVNACSHSLAWWRCITCGHEWESSIKNRHYGSGCPKCNQSKGEEVVGKVLEGLELSYEAQYRFSDCRYKNTLPFDFAILNEAGEVRCLIEFDGEQHFYPVEAFGGEEGFKQTQKRDQIKNKYCKDNNILLIRIPYWLRDHVEEVLEYWLKEYQII